MLQCRLAFFSVPSKFGIIRGILLDVIINLRHSDVNTMTGQTCMRAQCFFLNSTPLPTNVYMAALLPYI